MEEIVAVLGPRGTKTEREKKGNVDAPYNL
jgi:hypothetical protein